MKRNFSLIELMVVVAVFAILASLLFPSLKRMTSLSEMMHCKNNIKTCYIVTMQYTEDNDNSLPGGCATKVEPRFKLYPKWEDHPSYTNQIISNADAELSTFIFPYLNPVIGNYNRGYLNELICPTTGKLETLSDSPPRRYSYALAKGHNKEYIFGDGSGNKIPQLLSRLPNLSKINFLEDLFNATPSNNMTNVAYYPPHDLMINKSTLDGSIFSLFTPL